MVERSGECCLHVEGLNKTSGLASYKDFFFFFFGGVVNFFCLLLGSLV